MHKVTMHGTPHSLSTIYDIQFFGYRKMVVIQTQTQTQTQNILFNSNNHICKYKVKTEAPLGLFAFYSWKIFINSENDIVGLVKVLWKNVTGS